MSQFNNIFEFEEDDIVKNEKYLERMRAIFEEKKLNIYVDYKDLTGQIEVIINLFRDWMRRLNLY
jgi:hypothetical protein